MIKNLLIKKISEIVRSGHCGFAMRMIKSMVCSKSSLLLVVVLFGKISFNLYIKPNCTTVEIQCNSNSHKSLNKNLKNVILILQSFAEALKVWFVK